MDVKDFFTEVRRGAIAERSIVNKFGQNLNIPNGAWAIVSPSTPSGIFRSSPITVRIKAGGNTADTAVGNGAREVTVIGINSDLIETIETIITSGNNTSLVTTNSFWRIYRAYVSSVGTYGGTNVDDIIIEDSGGANNMLIISQGEGQTQHGAYTIPSGKTGYLLSMYMETDAGKAADFRVFVRENITTVQAPMSPKRVRLYFDGVLGSSVYKPTAPHIQLNALSDIWIEAEGSGAGTEVSVDFEILLVDNPTGPIR